MFLQPLSPGDRCVGEAGAGPVAGAQGHTIQGTQESRMNDSGSL